MNDSAGKRMALARACLLASALQVSTGVAHAYEPRTHQYMTEHAFSVMRMVAYQQPIAGSPPNPTLTGSNAEVSLWQAPAGVDGAGWQQFLSEIAQGHWRILSSESGLGNVGQCTNAGLRMVDLSMGESSGANTLGFHNEYLHKKREGDRQCAQEDVRGGLVSQLNVNFPHGQLVGSALGVHAADPDFYLDDWRVFLNATEAGFMGEIHQVMDKGYTLGMVVALAPFYCIARIFKGRSCSVDEIRDFADRSNPLPQIRGLISSAFSFTAMETGFTTGMGHLMNLAPFATSTHDDISGFHQERSGWRGQPGEVDLSLMLALDLTGTTVEPRVSNGVRDYEILSRDNEVKDGHQASARRTNARWRSATVGHTEFTPLDNLAYYGWQKALNPNFPDTPPGGAPRVLPEDLARTLHAIGDAAAPHHMIAGLGWGHRPYERMVDDDWDVKNPKLQKLTAGTTIAQYENAREILVGAYFWRNFIRDWRVSFKPSYPLDIPVRDMISAMAARNYSYIIGGDEQTHGDFKSRVKLTDLPGSAFPYVDTVDDQGSDARDRWRGNNSGQVAHLINNSVSGAVAFLSAASESMPDPGCGDGMVSSSEKCDDGNLGNGDGCSASCQIEPGFNCGNRWRDSWPSVCRTDCGNGIVSGGEECDDGPLGSNVCSTYCEIIIE